MGNCIYDSCLDFFIWFSCRSPPESVESDIDISSHHVRVTELSNRTTDTDFSRNVSDLTSPDE